MNTKDDELKNNEQPEAPEKDQEQPEQKPEAEQEQEPEQPEGEEQQQPEKEEPEQPSRRRDLRIKNLVEKLREKETPSEPTKKSGLNYRDELDADDETVKRLETDRETYGRDLYNEGMKRADSIQFHTRLEIDAPRVASKYPQFDPESSEFNPGVAGAINDWYLATVGYDAKANTVSNSRVRYADFVEGIMELADEMAGEKTANTRKNITRQAAQTGIRPNGSSVKTLDLNKTPEQMTDEELDAVIAQTIPPKTRRR